INVGIEVARKIQAGETSDRIHIGPRALLGVSTRNSQSPIVSSVQSGGPADSAGIERGDTITSIDGTQIGSADGIVAALNAKRPGDSVSVSWRTAQGQEKNATVELIAGPAA